MSKTRRGVYHNLSESEYAISNCDVAFFFSSEFYMDKFLAEYKDNRKSFKARLSKLFVIECLDFSLLADMFLYDTIEKRGSRVEILKDFNEFVILKRGEHEWLDLLKLGLHKMTEKNINDYEKTQSPK